MKGMKMVVKKRFSHVGAVEIDFSGANVVFNRKKNTIEVTTSLPCFRCDKFFLNGGACGGRELDYTIEDVNQPVRECFTCKGESFDEFYDVKERIVGDEELEELEEFEEDFEE